MTAYVSRPEHVDLHPSGWLLLPSGVQISSMPLVDRESGLYARLGPVAAEQWATSRGMRLPTVAECDALHERALYIEPCTLPTLDMLRAAGVVISNQAAVDSYRNAHMRSRAWCEAHDEEVAERLASVGWVNQPVSNAGKHWTYGGGIYGWWLPTGRKIQGLSHAHKGSGHTDYATTTHVVRQSEGAGPRRTTQGERGPDVEAWQRHLKAAGHDVGTIDGVHGAKTEAASRAYEAVRVEPPKREISEHIQARNYSKLTRPKVDLIVLHSTENPIKSGTAKAVATWFASVKAPRASAHYVVGPEVVIPCVHEAAIAWAAPGANHNGIQIEMVGQAAKTEWSRAGLGPTDGLAVLERTAELVRGICERWSIPVERVDAAGLKAGRRGITTHAAVTEAFGRSTHIDPGCAGDVRWPWELFLGLVRLK